MSTSDLPDLYSMDAALFDLDGTLVDSERVHRAAWRSFFDTRGWAVSEQTYVEHFLGRRGADTFRSLAGPWQDHDPDALLGEVLTHLAEVELEPEPVRGAAELIRAVHAKKIPVAVVTSAVRAWVGPSLKVLGVSDLVAAVVSAEDVTAGKPEPEGYLLACSRLGVDPDRVVAFEDSTSGVTAAVAAGISAVIGVLTTTPADALRAAGAAHLIQDLRSFASHR
ncbi:MAG: HAD family phosphatase [Actinomycetota bacterium]|nr:HAD family phosphatase [Actinomycetota bacterium]